MEHKLDELHHLHGDLSSEVTAGVCGIAREDMQRASTCFFVK